MAGDHLGSVRLSALADRFRALLLRSLYLSSQRREMACGREGRLSVAVATLPRGVQPRATVPPSPRSRTPFCSDSSGEQAHDEGQLGGAEAHVKDERGYPPAPHTG